MRKDNTALYSAIFIVALIARLFELILDPLLMRDSARYLHLAEIWFNTGDYSKTLVENTVVPPLPLFTIKEMMRWGYPAEIAGRSIALFLNSLIPVIGYAIAYKIFPKKLVVFACAFLFILNPTLISYSIQPLRENYYLFFLALTIYAVLKAMDNSSATNWMIVGCLSATAFFCRYEALELLLLCSAVLILLCFKKRISYKRALLNIVFLYCGTGITILLLLATTNFDISFVSKISHYKQSFEENVFDNLLYDSSKGY